MHETLIDTKYSDIQFLVNGQTVKAISIIIDIRCPTLLTKGIASKKRKEKTIYQLTPNEYMTKEVLVSLLYFLYSGALDPNITGQDLIRLLKASKVYQLRALQDLITKQLWDEFSNQNIWDFRKTAEALRCQPGKNLVNMYITVNYPSLVKELAPGISAIAEPSRSDLKTANHKLSIIKQNKKKIDPGWQNDFEAILIKMDKHDFLIVDDEKAHQGACHKAILAGHSPEMEILLETCKSSSEYFSSLTALSIEALLRWLYFGAALTDHNYAAEILTFAVEFKIEKLVTECEELLLPCINQDTVFIILQIVISTKSTKSQLKEACLDFVVVHLATLDFQQLKEMPTFVAQEVLKAIQRSVGSYWIVSSDMNAVGESSDESSDAPPGISSHEHSSNTISKPNHHSSSGGIPKKDVLTPPSIVGGSSDENSATTVDGGQDKTDSHTDETEKKSRDNKKVLSGTSVDASSESGSQSDSSESVDIKDLLPDPALEVDRRNTQQNIGALAKRKRKKVQGVKDLDNIFK